jgi:hypothetical protein
MNHLFRAKGVSRLLVGAILALFLLISLSASALPLSATGPGEDCVGGICVSCPGGVQVDGVCICSGGKVSPNGICAVGPGGVQVASK